MTTNLPFSRAFVSVLVLGAFVGFMASCEGKQQSRTSPETAQSNTTAAKAAAGNHPTLIGMQYETWFTPHNNRDYGTAEAIPILGKYNSYDVAVLRKHEEWFEDMGINWLLLDWSNMLWTKPAWEEHKDATRELEETTDLLFKTYAQLRKEGRHPPKLVIMLGLQNGPPVPHGVERLNGIIAWLDKNFLDKHAYKDLWLDYEGKPLLTILYNVGSPCSEIARKAAGVVAPRWTVRWIGSQLQNTHVENCGFWSWMDGPIRQVVTNRGGRAEEVVVTPSSFPIPGGWLDPRAVGRDHGAPYLESWKVAFESRPEFIQVHQWNEFAGQKEGQGFGPRHNVYGDEYNLELSDDIEPTNLHKCAYRGCGGWGYYYMNLTTALISLYRRETPGITVMALSSPFQPGAVKKPVLPLSWETIGKPPTSYTLQLDGKVVAENIHGESYALDLQHARPGKHRVTLVANGVHTDFDLSPEKLAKKSSAPIPVTSAIEFTYSPRH
ncbi:MAG: hypothetical protein M1423_03255 [Acidobacteria bacterium]|nr:hypothetical protein [Acidobacteriota bacterium]